MFKIAKQFDFCYGHRVWSQVLDKEFSIDDRCVCRHLHGHQGTIIIFLEGDTLQDGMVTDFKHLNWFKKWLDSVLDHKFIIHAKDPMFNLIISPPLQQMFSEPPLDIKHSCNMFEQPPKWNKEWKWVDYDGYGAETIDNDDLVKLHPQYRDIYEGFVRVPFIPTSENLSNWFCNIVNNKMKKFNCVCSHVTFFETPKSQSNYYL